MDLRQAIEDLQIVAHPHGCLKKLGESRVIEILEAMLIGMSSDYAEPWRAYYGIGTVEMRNYTKIGESLHPRLSMYRTQKRVEYARRLLRHPARMNILLVALGQELEEVPLTIDENILLRTLGLSERTVQCLELGNIYTVPELTHRSPRELLRRIPRLGMKLLGEIREELAVNGFSLRQE